MKLHELDESLRTENPCWKGYHPVGTKKKAGKTVPNCVPNANEAANAAQQAAIAINMKKHHKKPKNEGMAEDSDNIGDSIKALCQKIYNAGDDEFEYFYHDSPIFAQYWDEYEGDLDSIIAEVDPKELAVIKDELESYVQQAGLEEGTLDEALTDANFRSAGEYKRYAIEVRKTPFVNPTTKEKFYIAQTTIGKDELKTKGASPEQAVDALQQKIDFMLNAASKVSTGATLDFNVKFATQVLHDPRAQFYAKVENRGGEPKLVIASPEMMDFGRELMQLGFKPSALRVDPESERATPLPSISYSANQIANTGLIANGRYEIGHMQKDDEGNMVFDLKYHSTAHTKSDKIRLSTPSLTVGSNRATEGVANGMLKSFEESLEDERIGGRYDADEFDAMVSRVGQRAKQGPLKTIWDPERRIYKNVPADKEVDETSLSTMRDYFAGDKMATDPTKTTQMRDFFSKDKLPGSNVQKKEFNNRWEYEQWLKLKQHLKR